ncbi:cystathionine beta-synthase-like [Trichoplusia ni]|uniref:Cystathionine beta-synthase-like n=1 Tax=Trichoplusia ni TaxID=7111 RepID=A0A7E5WSH9_TRINI|nr:cystathionine beta-synthase-like [Trichoplusia ni]
MLGAEVIQANSKDLETSLLQQLKEENPDTYVTLNEHDNDVNPRTHYEATGLEIVSALGNVDMVVMGAGSGGTMTGVAQRLKQQNPHCIVVAAEPDGSTKIRSDGKSHPFLVEEIGGKLTSSVLDLSLIDQIEMVTDKESFLMARELAKKEGLLCGGSSGTAMSAAIKAAKALNFGIGQRVVVILPDGIRNYMSTFVSDPWMEAQGFMEPPAHSMTWWNRPICDLNLPHSYPKLDRECTCRQALKAMRINKVSIAVIVDKNGHFVGVVSKNSLRNKATNPPQLPGQKCKELDFEDVITNVLDEDVFTLAVDDDSASPTIGLLSRMLDITPFVIIGNKTTDVDTEQEYFVPSSVVTGDDILDYIELTPDTRTDTGNKKKSLTT